MALYERSQEEAERELWRVELHGSTVCTSETGGHLVTIRRLAHPSAAEGEVALARLVAEMEDDGFTLADASAAIGSRSPSREDEVADLHAHLAERLGALRSLVVHDVVRTFEEVASLPCRRLLWSLEFAFDEDTGRTARLEARFAPRAATNPREEDLDGLAVHVLLPRVLPPQASHDLLLASAENESPPGALVIRFRRSLAELGAYLTIETLEAREVELHLT